MKKILSYLILLLIPVILFSCKIKVSDSDGEEGENQVIFSNPYPSNYAIEVSLTPQLSWQYNTTGILNFEVFLDTNTPPQNLIAQVSYPYYDVTTPLQSNTTYYWRIRTIYEGNTYESAVWQFTTTSGGGGVPTAGLIAYYPFNGNAEDSSGKGHNGQVYYATPTVDRFNNFNSAYYFDGANSYILVPHSQDLQPVYGLTLSAWVNFGSFNNNGSILAKGSETSEGLYSLKYQTASQNLVFQIYFPAYSLIALNIYSSWQVNNWYNFICIYDGTYMTVYLNGQFNNQLNMTGLLGSNNEDLLIGKSSEGYMFNGDIDDIRIYNRALNSNEIQQVYHEKGW